MLEFRDFAYKTAGGGDELQTLISFQCVCGRRNAQAVMNENEWNQTLTRFQAFCRGYLMRKDLSSVQAQFEDIVRDIDGGLDHLQWKGKILAKPHFTDTESLLLQYGRSKKQSHDHFDNYDGDKRIDSVDGATPVPPSEVLVSEKDESPETGRDRSTPLDGENVIRPNLMDDSSTLWSPALSPPDVSSLIQKGPNLHFAFKETEHTSESLRQQRSTLAMELLWIQQAISSRKKYLTLRKKMDMSH